LSHSITSDHAVTRLRGSGSVRLPVGSLEPRFDRYSSLRTVAPLARAAGTVKGNEAPGEFGADFVEAVLGRRGWRGFRAGPMEPLKPLEHVDRGLQFGGGHGRLASFERTRLRLGDA
jgi:hypothetical protein